MDFFMVSCVILSTLMTSACGQNPRTNNGDGETLGYVVTDILGGDEEPGIPEMLQDLGLTTLIDRLNTAELTDLVRNEPVTIFGPTDQAFDRLMPWIQRRLRNVTALTRTLQHHVVNGLIFPEDLTNDMVLNTLLPDNPLRFNAFPKPSAPTVYTVQCSRILSTRSSENGVIHAIGKVLKPPYGDMLTSLTACPVFKNLTRAMRIVGLDNIVTGPYTLFAPTDSVFQRTYPGGLETLFSNTNQLRDMLLSHVVPGSQCTAGFEGMSLRTLSGRTLTPAVTPAGMTINGAKLILKDSIVTNGVVHCVNSLLWP